MNLTPVISSATNPFTNAAETLSVFTSPTPFVFVRFNPVTKAVAGKAGYCPTKKLSVTGGVLAADTFSELQASASSAGLVGTLTDPTPSNPGNIGNLPTP